MLCGAAIHAHAQSRLKPPCPLAGGDHEGVAAQSRHTGLKGRQRPKGRVQKHEAQNFARQGLRFRVRL